MMDILKAPFVNEMKKATANMYRLGWDERNGGNISYMIDEQDVAQFLDVGSVIRRIPTGFDASALVGKYFIVTGTGKYFKNVEDNPENNLGIIRIASDGTTAELLWGYKDGGEFTSELPAHLMSHMTRLKKDPLHGIYGAGRSIDETFGLIETVEKSAELYIKTAHLPNINTIHDSELKAVADAFGIDYRKDFLDL